MPSPFKLALITGASSGIGESLAYLLADKGIDLILHGRNKAQLEKTARDLQSKVKVEILIADLAQPGERKKIIQALHEKKPDLVINNAGFGLYGEALTCETKELLDIVEVNSMAVLELTLEAARALSANGNKGVILNVSSSAGEIPVCPGFTVYSASKAMVNRFSQSLDEELKKKGIRVLVACPGFVRTNFRQRAGGGQGEDSAYSKLAMTREYAAQQIWRQIENLKPIHIFDWKTRFLVIGANIFPKKWVAALYRKVVRHQ